MNYTLKPGMLEIEIPAEYNHLGITEFMKNYHISGKKRNDLFLSHGILLNRKDASPASVLHEKDRLTFRLEQSEIDYAPADTPCEVVYEDDFVYVAHKEAGILVHDHDDRTCLASQAAAWQLENGISTPVRYIHRLDQETTGLVLFVKVPLLQGWYDAMLEEKKIERQYLAITDGKGHKGQKFTYNQKIGRDRHESGKYRFSETGKEAVTKAAVLDRKHDDLLMRCRLMTGRTHQIRVHLSGNRHPIVNDPLYGIPSSRYRNMGLWADTLIFFNPFTGERCEVHDRMNPDYAGFDLSEK